MNSLVGIILTGLAALGFLAAPLSCTPDCGLAAASAEFFELAEGAGSDLSDPELDHEGAGDCCSVCHASARASRPELGGAALSFLKFRPLPAAPPILPLLDALFRPPRV